MPQGLLASGLELFEAKPQPVETMADAVQVSRSAHLDRFVKTSFAQAVDRFLQFFDGAGQPTAHGQRDEECADAAGGDESRQLHAVLLQFRSDRCVLFIDPLAVFPVERSVDFVQAVERRQKTVG